MAPAQPSLKIDQDSKLHYSPKIVGNIANQSSGKGLSYLRKCHGNITELENQLDEQVMAPECTDDVRAAQAEDPDATDYSSSFDGTVSGTEDCSRLSDTEVDSCFYGDNSFAFDGLDDVFPVRKKKLTTHWRNFIRPLMWRCKWTELKIKEFRSQASKYARELEACDKRKQLELDQFTLEKLGSKSLPVTFASTGKKSMKRRKRQRVEDAIDITSFMSQHNLFCYHENKWSDTDGTFVAEEFGNPVTAEHNTISHEKSGIQDDCFSNKSEDGSYSLEEILQNVETVHSRVRKLKSRLVEVVAENCMKFSSYVNLSLLVPCDGQTSSARSPTFSACNGDGTSLGGLYNPDEHMPEYDIGDFVMPESVMSSYGEVFSVPDIIESTVSLLSSADVTMHQAQIADSCEAIMDNVQIHNQAAEEDWHTSEKIPRQTKEKLQEPEGSGQEESSNPNPSSEPDLMVKTATPNEQSGLTSCLATEIHFPKSKRKRGERKAGSGGWNR